MLWQILLLPFQCKFFPKLLMDFVLVFCLVFCRRRVAGSVAPSRYCCWQKFVLSDVPGLTVSSCLNGQPVFLTLCSFGLVEMASLKAQVLSQYKVHIWTNVVQVPRSVSEKVSQHAHQHIQPAGMAKVMSCYNLWSTVILSHCVTAFDIFCRQNSFNCFWICGWFMQYANVM